MAKRIPSCNIHNGKRVTAICPDVDWDSSKVTGISIAIERETSPRKFSHVVSTIPFGTLRMVDTDACALSWDLQTAIRALSYQDSTKIGIKFKERWWEKLSPPQRGGVSYTDRPTRMVVYPSYGIGGPDAAITASYSWAQDASRLGAFDGSPESKRILLSAVLKDLAVIHGIQDCDYLRSLVVDYDVWHWYNNKNTAGT